MMSVNSRHVPLWVFFALAVCFAGTLPGAVNALTPQPKPAPTPAPKVTPQATVSGYNPFGWQRVWPAPSSSQRPAPISGNNPFGWQRVWPAQPKAKGFPVH
jgi:hypothetical protein